jgi:hypothetical protein
MLVDRGTMRKTPLAELDALFDELEQLLKNPEVQSELASKGVNSSLGLTVTYGLRAYAHGDKRQALLELGTATDEIAARLASASTPPKGAPS